MSRRKAGGEGSPSRHAVVGIGGDESGGGAPAEAALLQSPGHGQVVPGGAAVAEEFFGCIVSAFFMAITFYMPGAVRAPYPEAASMVLFFSSLMLFDLFKLSAHMNPVVHAQKVLLHGRRFVLELVVFAVLDMAGMVIGNWLGAKAVHHFDPHVDFAPPPPNASYWETVVIEGAILFVLQGFGTKVTSSRVLGAVFCTAVIFVFIDVTGGYANPVAYFAKVVLAATGVDDLHPHSSAYIVGPVLGSLAAFFALPPIHATPDLPLKPTSAAAAKQHAKSS